MLLSCTSAQYWTWVCCLCLLLTTQSSCGRVDSRGDVIGSYELGSDMQKIELDIKSSGVYQEVITLDGKVADRRSGSWRWGPRFVDFDSLWIPRQFAPEYILRADSAAAPGEPKYTLPGHWSSGAEKHLGRVVLVVFPGADVNFTMTKRGTN